ncbi:hypothetical protein XENOCAPTIV_009572 [Xenoophorus captivus]|uniref:Neurofibromin n=1 Tax=Xenoophorus captivus TaxID=1517983 RepID=A0ABV0RGX1_9TELE
MVVFFASMSSLQQFALFAAVHPLSSSYPRSGHRGQQVLPFIINTLQLILENPKEFICSFSSEFCVWPENFPMESFSGGILFRCLDHLSRPLCCRRAAALLRAAPLPQMTLYHVQLFIQLYASKNTLEMSSH